ncbi:Sporulation protein YpeB [compost metagenome]
MKVTGQTLAVIKNDLDEEVLCYEFIGTMNKNIYRIFINADMGLEEKIETIRQEQAEAAQDQKKSA